MVFNRFNRSEGLDFLRGLCQQFEKNITRYRQPSYDEADTRQDLIERLFLSLGWDVHNEQGASPQYKEVKFEGRVRIKEKGRETVKNPDLVFNMGPQPVFFVEIKPPHIRVPDAPSAFQLRRYAWSKHLPVSILTNFEDFCVYDTRYRPDINDNPKIALVKEINHKDYVKEFEYLWNTFSYEAVKGGSIEKFAEETRDKRGHMDVDDAFLKDIENFRYLLARNIELRNPLGKPFGVSRLNIYELNDMVQKVIDRIIFLRICEDREIEEYGNLKDIVDEGSDIYERLMVYFGRAENRYNAGLFNLREDIKHLKSSPTIVIDDRVLSEIINSLYYPKSPYIFSEIPVEILGQVYERFLGKTIRLTPSGQAKIEYKPEVRKAGGIYYTPKYIVDYIVENTLGRLLEGKKPGQVKKIRILDPACGSGSFLLGAYGYLLRWYLERYIEDKDKYLDKTIYKRGDDEYRLMIDERKRILMEQIYGVDIDPQAVEVTKLSLHLKVLEGETGETLDGQLALIKEPALPDLERNIRCGNSLIGPDFYKQFDIGLFDDDEIRRINVFDWYDDERGFGEIMKDGGFDVVIGNPPYIFTRNQRIDEKQKNYYYTKYKYQSSQLNTFGIFIEKCYELVCNNGRLGFITPNNWLTIDGFSKLRKFIIENTGDIRISNIIDKVFSSANVDTSVLIFENSNDTKITISEIINEKENIICLEEKSIIKSPIYIIQISLLKDNKGKKIIEKIELFSKPLSYFSKVSTGLKAYQIGKGNPQQTERHKENRVFHANKKIDETYGYYVDGADVCRYYLRWSGKFLSYGDWLAEPRRSVPFNGERLLVRQIPSKPPYLINAVFLSKQFYNDINSMVVFNPISRISLKYLLGIINSKLISFWFNKSYDKLQRNIFPQFKVKEFSKFPIRDIDFNNSSEIKMHDEMVSLVERMMILKKRYNETTEEQLRQQLDHAINATDEQIDHLVYKLYNLTDEEIRVVEGI